MVRDESKEKTLTVEMGWVGEKTNGKHQAVPKEVSDHLIILAVI